MALVGSPIGKPWGRRLPVSVGGVVGPLVADILLDFANSVYRVDGVTYATAALAGFTGTGTFDATGYTAVINEQLTGTVDLPGDYVVFCDFATGDTSLNRIAWRHMAVSFPALASNSSTISVGFVSRPSPTRVAFGLSGGIEKASFDNAAVLTGTAKPSQGSASFRIGNNGGGQAWAVPIRKIAIYKQTLSDAQIQALS